MRKQEKLRRAVKLADQLIRVTSGIGDDDAHITALRLRHQLQPTLSMADIIARVPGETLTARAEALGLSRQAIYDLRDGKFKPSAETVQRLAALTGIAQHVIMAR